MRKINSLKISLMCGILFLATQLWASNEQDNAALTERIKKIEESISLKPKISGYLQTGWNYTSNDLKKTSSFQAKRLRLLMDGNVSSNISFRLQLEAFSGISGTLNGRGQKNIQVMDAFATWRIKPHFQIRAGQFFTPISFENYDISPATLETVDFSNIVYRMICRNPISYDYVDYGRDLGVMVMGDLLPSEEGFNYLSYNVALTNGQIPLRDDNNTSKDIIASLSVRPIKHLLIKGAFNWGEYFNDLPGVDNSALTSQYQSMNRFVLGAWYNNPKGLTLRSEFGRIKSNSEIKVDEIGAYVLAGYYVNKWLPMLRWDMYKDSEHEDTANNYNRLLAGVTYHVTNNFKIQGNYNYKMYTSNAKSALGFDKDHQIQIMALYKF